MLRKLFELLASLKLALCLLAVLILACAVGTWYESKLNADVAREYIYNAWWFNSWMVLLGVNLFCAAAIRYPWKPHQTGFVITHAGLILMLIGGLIDRRYGIEGNIELNRGDVPATKLELLDQEFLVFAPDKPDLAPGSTVFRVRAALEDIHGSSYLAERDVGDWAKLCASLAEDGPMTAASPARRVWKFLPEELQKDLKKNKAAAAESASTRITMLSAINDALASRDFYAERDFAGVELSDEAKRLLTEPLAQLSARQIQRVNRLLLEASFPDGIRAGRLKSKPMAMRSPSEDIQVRVVDMQPAQRKVAALKPDPSGFPAIKLVLTMPGRAFPFFFRIGDEESPMPNATLGFKHGMPPDAGAKPAPEAPKNGDKPGKVPQSERHFTFAKQSELADMVTQVVGPPANAKAKLTLDEKSGEPRLALTLEGKSFDLPVLANVGKETQLDGLSAWKLAVIGYYPNFKINSGKPSTDGEKPINPCVIFELRGPLVDAPVAKKPPSGHGGSADEGEAADGTTPNGVTIYLGDDGKLRYHVRSRKTSEKRGDVALGAPVELGWAAGATATVEAFEPKGKAVFQWTPMDAPASKMDAPSVALKCEVTVGSETQSLWVGPSVASNLVKFPVEVAGRKVDLAYATREARLPFSVELVKFSAPNQEGLEGSEQFAAFESTLCFDGDKDQARDKVVLKPDAALMKYPFVQERSGVLEGAITELDDTSLTLVINGHDVPIKRAEIEAFSRQISHLHKIHMNHPTTFPETWYGPWLGTSYKFSQASFKQGSTDTSIVQVLRDPGWMPKWVGSLMICFGIFTMFYLKPYFRRVSEPATQAQPAAEKAVAAPSKDEKAKPRKEVAVKGT